MTIPRDPNQIDPRPADPLIQDPIVDETTHSTAERNEMRRAEGGWGIVPGLVGIAIVIALGLMLFTGGNDTSTPTQTKSTDVQTPATTPKTTPTQPQ
jgi:hypothetical protein